MIRIAPLALSLLLLGGCSQPAAGPSIRVTDAWARATVPGQSSGAIYATIENKGEADRLVGVTSDAGMAMLHANEGKDGVARMRMIGELEIPAAGRVPLAPGGTHVMLSGLKAPLTAGGDLAVTMRFALAGAQPVKVAIVDPGAR